jgi:addiction module HigA family antidote
MSIPRNPDQRIPPIHPGEYLREDLMKPLRLSAKALAAVLHVPASRISAIARERRDIDAEMALRLSRYFRSSARFWMNWQTQYDLTMAADHHLPRIRREVRPAPRNPKTGELKPAATA